MNACRGAVMLGGLAEGLEAVNRRPGPVGVRIGFIWAHALGHHRIRPSP